MQVLATTRRVWTFLAGAVVGFLLLRLYRVCRRLEADLDKRQGESSQLHERLCLLDVKLVAVEAQLRAFRVGSAISVRASAEAADQAHSQPGAKLLVVDEPKSASRIQSAYRGHRARRAFFKLVAQATSAAPTAGRGFLQFANRSARKFWEQHVGERRVSKSRVLRAFDRWLQAGDLDGAQLNCRSATCSEV